MILLGLTAQSSELDVAIQKKIYGSGITALIISNEEMKNSMAIVNHPEESDLLIKGVSKTLENEAKEPKSGFIGIGTIAAS